MNRALLQTASTSHSARLMPYLRSRRKVSTSAGPSHSSIASASKQHADTPPLELDIIGTAPYHKSYTIIQHTDSPLTYPSKVNNLTSSASGLSFIVSTRKGLVNHWHDPFSTIGPPIFGKGLSDGKRSDGQRYPHLVFGVDKTGRNGRLLSTREKINAALAQDPEWKWWSEEERRARRDELEDLAEKKMSKDGYTAYLTDVYDEPELDVQPRPIFTFESNEQVRKYHTLLLVCTHGARDCRCGDTGGALVKELNEELARRKKRLLGISNLWWSGVKVGEIAHVGGHKYAANMLIFPYGDWLGNLRPHHAPQILDRLYEYLLLYNTHLQHGYTKTPLAPLTPVSSSQGKAPAIVARDYHSSLLFLPSSEELQKNQCLEKEVTEQEHASHMPPFLPDRSLWRGRMGLTKEDARNLMDTYDEELTYREALKREFVSNAPLPDALKQWLMRRKLISSWS